MILREEFQVHETIFTSAVTTESKIMTGKGNLASGSYPNELTPTIK